MTKFLEKLDKLVFGILIVFFPIFVLPIFANVHLPAKTAFLTISILILLIIKLAKVIIRGSIELSIGKYDLIVLGIATIYVASSLFLPVNKMDAFFLPGTTTLFIATCILYLVINQTKNKEGVKNLLILSGALIGLTILLSISGLFGLLTFLPSVLRSLDFNFVGGYLPSLLYLVAILPLVVVAVVNEKNISTKIYNGICMVLISFGIFVSGFNILPGKPQALVLPSMSISWQVAVDTLKESPLLGIGPSNYLIAYNKYRPLISNKGDNWRTRAISANSFYITNLTETGLISFALFVMIVIGFIKTAPGNFEQILLRPEMVSLGVLLILGLIFPFNIAVITLLFILLALSTTTHKVRLPLMSENPVAQTSIGYKIPVFIVTLPLMAILIYVFTLSTRYLKAEVAFARGVNAVDKNDGGKEAYESISEAIKLNPEVDRYHASMAQVDLAIANLIVKKGPEKLTPQDRELISRAVKEAIDQAKINASLNRRKAANWELLANIYKSIIPYAKDADSYAISAYAEAVRLDPLNPLTRIALGEIYFGKRDFDMASDIFKLAVLAKEDYPNAHFNLAASYREEGKIEQAIEEVKITLSLIQQKDSTDYKLAQNELERLESRINAKAKNEAEAGSELTLPEPIPTPIIEPQIEVSEPEQSLVPSPTPTNSPTPAP